MNRLTSNLRHRLPGLVALAALVVLPACATINNEVELPSDSNAQTAMRVKAALMKSSEVDAAPIRVQIENGSVVLDGFVASQAIKEHAEATAREAATDKPIINRLSIR